MVATMVAMSAMIATTSLSVAAQSLAQSLAVESDKSTSRLMPWLPLSLAVIFALQAAAVWVLLIQNRRQRRAAEEIRHQRAEIAHAARLTLVGEMTASIAHEVSQPLGAILSNAEAAEMLLKQSPINLDEVQHILRDIRSDDLRAHEIIGHLRTLLQKRELQLETVNINEMASHVRRIIENDARRRDITIKTTFDPQLPPIKADPIHLKQVLLNLVVNAMDAVDQRRDGPRVLEVSTGRNDAKTVKVSVVDSGPGFGSGPTAKLFEPFVTSKPHGMGLGLSIARTIVQAHGGKIWAENGATGGGVVSFAIPIQGS